MMEYMTKKQLIAFLYSVLVIFLITVLAMIFFFERYHRQYKRSIVFYQTEVDALAKDLSKEAETKESQQETITQYVPAKFPVIEQDTNFIVLYFSNGSNVFIDGSDGHVEFNGDVNQDDSSLAFYNALGKKIKTSNMAPLLAPMLLQKWKVVVTGTDKFSTNIVCPYVTTGT